MRVHFTTDDGELLESLELENPDPTAQHPANPATRLPYLEGEVIEAFGGAWRILVARATKGD